MVTKKKEKKRSPIHDVISESSVPYSESDYSESGVLRGIAAAAATPADVHAYKFRGNNAVAISKLSMLMRRGKALVGFAKWGKTEAGSNTQREPSARRIRQHCNPTVIRCKYISSIFFRFDRFVELNFFLNEKIYLFVVIIISHYMRNYVCVTIQVQLVQVFFLYL